MLGTTHIYAVLPYETVVSPRYDVTTAPTVTGMFFVPETRDLRVCQSGARKQEREASHRVRCMTDCSLSHGTISDHVF